MTATRIITLAEREAMALSKRRAAIAEAQKRLTEAAATHGGSYLVFGSVARSEIHARSDLDLLADFPRENTPDAIRAAERICRELGVPCDVLDKFLCTPEFLAFNLPDSRMLA